jgi:hypothetical protein
MTCTFNNPSADSARIDRSIFCLFVSQGMTELGVAHTHFVHSKYCRAFEHIYVSPRTLKAEGLKGSAEQSAPGPTLPLAATGAALLVTQNNVGPQKS